MKFFFYGIFLSEHQRKSMGIHGPAKYATVLDYATYGQEIVMAHFQADAGLSLTGLVIDVPSHVIPALDALEFGYKRKQLKTVQGEQVYMYVA